MGTLYFESVGARQRAAFAYHSEWLEQGFAVEPGLPLVPGPQFHQFSSEGSVFHGALADTEPDGWAKRVILRDHAKRRLVEKKEGSVGSLTHLNAMDFLLAVDDFSRVGVLRFKDESGVFCRSEEVGRRTAPPLLELNQLLKASHAVESENETTADLAYLLGRGTSLGGMRPKCTVVDDDGRLAIGKFPSIKDGRAVTKGEVLALTLARSAGIIAAEARLVECEGLAIALIRRFDRAENGRRLMYVSAATLVGAGTERDHFYTEIVDAIRVHGADAQADTEELWRRIAYSILITNIDDHLHNHGFLHLNNGRWRLAPAFDINPFPERLRELKTWISEEAGPEATIEALMSVIGYFRVPLVRAREILREVILAVSQWREHGKSLGMTDAEMDHFEDAFEHPERKAAVKAMG